MPKRTGNRSPAQLEAEKIRALELISFGKTEREAAQIMTDEGSPISQATVHRRVHDAIAEYRVPELEAARNAALARLDSYLAAMADKILAGDTKAIAEAIKIEDRRARILGTDQPIKTEIELKRSPADIAMAERMARMAQQDALEG